MTEGLSIHAANAISSLSASQLSFIKALPKAELHAHLNGSIPLPVLQDLAKGYTADEGTTIQAGIERLQAGVELNELHDFFSLFGAIYALTSTPAALARVTHAVLHEFLNPQRPQAAYIELRSTPKHTPHMTRTQYVEIVLGEIEKYGADQAALIVSLDRTMGEQVAAECIDIAISMKNAGRRVVGVDLCGDPTAGDMNTFARHFKKARDAGLGITLHISETTMNTPADTLTLLSFKPDRLGHATFLNQEAKEIVLHHKIPIELCISSNLLCKTVTNIDDHHIRYYLKNDHPISICTDDILPFRTSMIGEYALLLAEAPSGLGLSEAEVERISKMGFESRFKP